MRTKSKVPADWPVKPLKPGQNPPGKATCGTCGRSWDDSIGTEWTPAPAGRCPFEYFHDDPKPERAITSKTFIGPTCGAFKAAKIIMAGEKAINTDYGRKSVIGLAEIIDRESGLRRAIEALEAWRDWSDDNPEVPQRMVPTNICQAIDSVIDNALPRG